MYLKKLLNEIGLDAKEFNFQFQSHPNYPSALALGDTLNFLGIENSAYELEKEYWNEIPSDFITLYNQKFALIKKEANANNFSVFSDVISSINERELLNNSSELVILLSKNNNESKQQNNYSTFLLILILFAAVINILTFSWILTFYNILSLVGVFISYEIFKEKFGIESPVLNSICGNVHTSSNCNKIIKSDKINLLGLKLSDISLVYFTGLFIIGTLFSKNTSILFALSSFASTIILYSLYIQIFVEKKLCKVCITIIGILIAQLITAYFFVDKFQFDTKNNLSIIFLFVIVLFSISIYNRLVLNNQDLRKSNIKNLKFKRNYDLFKRQLMDSDRIIFKNDYNSFILGNLNAKVHISLISNPFCGYCKEAHEIIERILIKYPDSISAQIRFNYNTESKDDNLKIVLSHFKNIYENYGGSMFMKKVSEWFKDRDLQQLKKNEDSETIDLSEESAIGLDNFSHGLSFTPIFLINGYRFPQSYDRKDIFYFIDELIEDEDLLINKIAKAEKLTE